MNTAPQQPQRRGMAVRAVILVGLIGIFSAVMQAAGGRPALAGPEDAGSAPLLQGASVITTTMQYLPITINVLDAPSVYGIEDNPILDNVLLDLTLDAGTYWLRRNGLLWSDVEPVQGGGYQWANVADLEAELLLLSQSGLQPVLVIRSTPAWAQLYPGVFCGPMQAQYYDEFGQFLAATVTRYSGPPYYIRQYEIWNEPDVDASLVDPLEIFGCWGDDGDPYYGGRTYGQMLKVVYPMMKAANSGIEVIIGGLLLDCDPENPPPGKDCTPSRYLEGILVAGAKNSFDAVAFHAYDYYNWVYDTYGNPNWNSGRFLNEPNGVMRPVLYLKEAFIRDVLNSFGVGNKMLYNTEVALLCGDADDPPGQTGCEATDNSPFELMKMAYAAQAYASAIGEGLKGNVWFSIRGWRNSGLVFQNASPRPAYYAIDFSNEMLGHAKYVGMVTGYPSVVGYKFDPIVGNNVWVIWSTDGADRSITLPATPLAIWDSVGAAVAVTGPTVTVGTAPYYFEMP